MRLTPIDDRISAWIGAVIDFLPDLLLIALILGLTLIISHRMQSLARQFARRTQAPPEIGDLLARIVRPGIMAIGGLLVLGRLGLSDAVLSFIAGLGIAGIVIGFALQDIVKQFAAGVLLLMLRPFHIGDEVQIGAYNGQVIDVQLRATILKTELGDEVLIPNADVYTTAIINMSRYNLRRHTVTLSVPSSLDLEHVRGELTRAITKAPGLAVNPAPSVIGIGLNGGSVKLDVRFWIDKRSHDPGATTTEVIDIARRVLEQSKSKQ